MKSYFLLFALLTSLVSFGQKSTIKGLVVDKNTNESILYAEVTVSAVTNDTITYGAITNEKGFFQIKNVPYGTYIFNASFLGFSKVQKEIVVTNKVTNLETIFLEQGAENLDEVVVTKTKAAIQYKVDRQIINAASFPEATVAVDLLKNVPSLQVDVTGEVTYRGDGTFKVYINGHPVPNGTEKLQQIPAEQIDHIEVITNPSSEFSAEGTAGIIQIILKKTRLEGYAINVTASTSTLGSYYGNASIDKKTDKSGWYINVNGGRRFWNKIDHDIRQSATDNELLYATHLVKTSKRGNKRIELETGFNYDITDKDYIDVAFNIEPIKNQSSNLSNGWVSTEVYENTNLIEDGYYDLISSYKNKYGYYGGSLSYNHFFNEDKSHKLIFDGSISNYMSPYEEAFVDTKVYETETQQIGSQNYEKNELMISGKFTYEHPFSETTLFKIGADVDIDNIPEIGTENGMYVDGNLIPFSNQRSNQIIDYSRTIYSGFTNFSSSYKKFEYKLGLRTEYEHTKSNYTYINSNGSTVYEPASYNRTKLFPSAYLLYNWNDDLQLTASYSRRIERPGYFSLVPVFQYSTVTSYYQGNADILPTYINAYEIAYKQNWTDTDYLSIQAFHNVKNGVSTSYNYTYEDGTIISKEQNVGDSYSTGIEFMGNMKPVKWWQTNLSLSLFNYKLDVDFEDTKYTQEQFNYNVKFNNTFTISDDFSIQSNSYFYGDSKGAQNYSKGAWFTSIGVNKSFLKDSWKVNLSGDNIFNTRVLRNTTTGDGFSNYSKMVFSPKVTLKVSYTFDNQN
ncbi:TonB-dependent receptor [Neptunitalea chrysea]|uniref:TonB-dependent receptor n=1 Tax=Neptunitalea chrysea TaxID=1647581 RepID=A0A9W6B8M1_9FLAO|nr:outer membrane beta-barrel family protein [Neptunitalea chrysea]GLB52933.1 TonB-dependent receptor [Neptunitalea chrysea]